MQQNIKQQKKLRAEVKSKQNNAARGSVKGKPSKKKDGFFAKVFGTAPQSVQQSIPYINMYRDGICRVSEREYNKTIQFFDINYQLAQADDQALIFENYCDFLNYFDSSISVQLTLVNQRTNIRDFQKSIQIPLVGDEHDDTRKEYNGMLQGQLRKGNNGITKRKYITFGIRAKSFKEARPRLRSIENDVFKGCRRLKRIYIPNDEFSIFKYMNALEKYSKYIFVLDKDGQEIKPVVSDKYKVEEVDDSETLSYIKEYLQSLTHIRISDDAKAVIEVILALGVIFFCVLYFAFDLDFWISLLVSPVVSAVGVGVYFLQDWINRHGGDGGFNGDGGYDFSGGSDEF